MGAARWLLAWGLVVLVVRRRHALGGSLLIVWCDVMRSGPDFESSVGPHTSTAQMVRHARRTLLCENRLFLAEVGWRFVWASVLTFTQRCQRPKTPTEFNQSSQQVR